MVLLLIVDRYRLWNVLNRQGHCGIPKGEQAMPKQNDRTVYKTPDGWKQKRDNASRAGSIQPTQSAAEADAKRMTKAAGGGEVKVKGVDGKIRSKDTVAPGNDPNPPKDKEH